MTGNFSRSRTMPFDSGDASGWDECLPSVAPCRVRTDGGTAVIPDHGDLWRVAWQILETAATRCTMLAKCFSLPLELVRTATAERIDAVFRIRLDYRIRNIGAHTTPWAWSAHPLFAVQPGDRILLPESVKSLRVEASGGGRLSGCVVRWPIDSISAGLQGNLSIAQSPNSEIGDKLFAGPLHGAENWAVLERHSAHVRIRVTFDPAANPFLGLWLCYGGWPLRPGPKQMCVALEPSTSPVDSLASTGKWQRLLEPGESFAWTMTVELQQI
ncbi:MAG TPA: hypothetical protein VKT75_00640 [Acidobacteriaceae bacterium]|nr:hypothetical protein [Acidobacteriaceae bacterium]